MRGKLVPQDPNDEPASLLLKKIAREKARLIKEEKIKKQKPPPKISDDEKPFELPVGWEWTRLGNVGNIFNGNSVSARVKEEKYTNIVGGLPFIATKDVGYGWEKFDYDNGVSIPKNEPKFNVAHKDAVLICAEGGSAGKKCGITNQDICFGNKLFANELYGNIQSKYILSIYLSLTFYYQFRDKMTGIIGGISSVKFNHLLLPIPPIFEQKQIVAKVDELMTLCDKLEQQQTDSDKAHQTLVETLLVTLTTATDYNEFSEAWKRIANHFDILFTTEQSIDQLKQTILQLAVMGKLVPQNPKDEPASVLLKKIAKEKARLIKEGKIKKQKKLPEIREDEKLYELPQGWEWVRFGDVLDLISDYHANGSYKILKDNVELLDTEDYAIMLRTTNFSKLNRENYKYITKKAYNFLAKSKVVAGDIIMNKIGDPGACFFVDDRGKPMSLAMNLFLLRTSMKIHSKFAYLHLLAQLKYVKSFAGGTSTQTITKDAVNNLIFPLCPNKEQTKILAKVDELMAICDFLKDRLKETQTTQVQLADAIAEQAVA